MSALKWSPGQYLKFEDERTRPARDLLAAVPQPAARRVVDMGCGPGNSTALLAARWPEAEVIGLDTSEAMLAEARGRLPEVRFDVADATTWLPEAGTDVVFANAIYQWVPGHMQVLPRIAAALDAGATLAVQMPDNLTEPTHVLMRDVGARMRFAEKFAGVARKPLPAAEDYYDALSPHAQRIDIWRTTYSHVMADADAIVEWVKGTGLAPFLQRLDAAEQAAYLAAYREAIGEAYPPAADGKVLLAFPRRFIVLVR